MIKELTNELQKLDERNLFRVLRPLACSGGKIPQSDDRTLLNFSSNDYLNLASDPRLKTAAAEAVEHFGCGATASRLMSGTLELHERLEEALARLTGCEATLVFGSGFLANLGILTTLAGPRDAVFSDRLNHASLIDGARLSGARMHRFRHGDAGHLDELLKREAQARRRIVVTESVFSMDGDQAPLEAIAIAARRHDALLIVDEAHAIGVCGPSGGGLCRLLDGELAPDAIIGTLSKSLGSYGGFVACSAALRDLLINRARSFIYSTALPPPSAAAALAAAEIVMNEPALGPRLLTRARMLAGLLRERGLKVPEAESPILPVVMGDNRRALDMAENLRARGVLAVAVRPPTVPAGTARLRLSVTLAHERDDLLRAADAISAAARECGVP